MSEYQEWGEGRFEDTWLNEGFITMPVILLFDTLLSDGAKITYGVLCWHIWRHGKVPPQIELAEELGAGVRTIKRHLAELEKNDYIERIQHGLGKPNSYIIKSLSSQVPKMALQEGQRWHFKSAKGGPSYNNALDSKNHKQQQQGQPMHLPLSQSVSAPPDEEKIDAVVAFQIPTAQELSTRLAALGVTKSTAGKLIREHKAAAIYRWVCYVEHRLQSGWLPRETPAAWLVSAIRSKDWVIPDWFQTPEEHDAAQEQKQRQARVDQKNREAAAAQEQQAAEAQRLAIEQRLGIDEKSRTIWQKTLGLLQERDQMSPALLSAFLLPLEDGKAIVATPVKFFGKVIAQNADIIQSALEEVTGKGIEGVEVQHLELEDTGSD
jgi:hypothetical protein